MIESVLSSVSDAYIDALHNDSTNKQRQVECELESSKIMLLLRSRSIHKSSWVKREIEIATKLTIPIININLAEELSYTDIKIMIFEALSVNKKTNKCVNRTSQSVPIGLPLWSASYA